MDLSDLKDVLENLDHRLERVEQVLPTLATKEELRPLATKEELRATVREEGERTRRHFDVVAESLRDQITLIAEGHATLSASLDSFRQETRAGLSNHDLRITRLEVKRPKR